VQRVKTARLIKPRGNGVHSAASRNVSTSGCGWRVSGTLSSQIHFSISASEIYKAYILEVK